ncbi:hypothetical protein BaRGS_00004431 [Batillaria attramentaria]|uniref:Uncharacterized protein n=1 Tax=Batillaria attramentaria TaxID=370345 RepID=A0ABD0LXK5_9CAEN
MPRPELPPPPYVPLLSHPLYLQHFLIRKPCSFWVRENCRRHGHFINLSRHNASRSFNAMAARRTSAHVTRDACLASGDTLHQQSAYTAPLYSLYSTSCWLY